MFAVRLMDICFSMLNFVTGLFSKAIFFIEAGSVFIRYKDLTEETLAIEGLASKDYLTFYWARTYCYALFI